MSRLIAALVALLAAALALASPATAEERIESFHSDIAVMKDGSLDVTERIRVQAEGNEIRRGIYRDFPTRYSIPRGGKMKVGFELLQAGLDGRPVENKVESRGNGVRIRLGSKDTLVETGSHTYTIRYRVTRVLGFFPEYDELYWNVTGNGWGFPIDQASATIRLPEAAAFGQRAAYTGGQGSTATNATVTADRPGEISFATTVPLAPYQGLTVAAAFPKGVVNAPSDAQRTGWWILDMLPVVAAGLTLLLVGGFLVIAYRRAGRDPRPGTVVPIFSPPDGLSPAAMRYVTEQGFDNRAFAATLVNAGVKGHLRLVDEPKMFGLSTKRFIEGTPAMAKEPLESAERLALDRLVSGSTRLEMDKANHATFNGAKEILSSSYAERFDGVAFKRNYEWVGLAILVWLGGAYLTALAILASESAALGPFVLIPVAAIIVGIMLWAAGHDVEGCAGTAIKLAAIAAFLVSLAMIIAALPTALGAGRWLPVVIAALGLPLALSAFFWISAPTREGRAMLDRIAGFKQYLSITEGERLDRMQAPKDTLTLFEKFLPYAIALGVENRWADRFATQLAAASVAAQGGAQFGWYAGDLNPWTDTGRFTNSLGGALAGAISSASTAPGSSSGSGGGGFSGGGGGGGGGGGW